MSSLFFLLALNPRGREIAKKKKHQRPMSDSLRNWKKHKKVNLEKKKVLSSPALKKYRYLLKFLILLEKNLVIFTGK
jgi:hypothetical protein